MASGGRTSSDPPIDTIAGVVADAVRRSLSDFSSSGSRAQIQTRSTSATSEVDLESPGNLLHPLPITCTHTPAFHSRHYPPSTLQSFLYFYRALNTLFTALFLEERSGKETK